MVDVIRIPAEALEGAQSFGIDFGGSVLKLVYMKKDEVHPEGQKLVHLKVFPRENLEEALAFIKKECYVSEDENGDPREYLLTGLGTHQYNEDFKEQLGITVKSAWEMACFQDAFKLLINNLPDKELFHPPEYHDDGSEVEFAANVSKIMDKIGDTKQAKLTFGDGNEKWPVLMGVLGSAFMFFKLEEDGTNTHGDATSEAGRTFLGLGSVLTGAKSFDELVELAEKGDDRNVNCYTHDMMEPAKDADEDKDNVYGKFSKLNTNAFSFGWCVGKSLDDFKREDMARALAVVTANQIVRRCLAVCEKLKVSNIILVGGFAQSKITRYLIEKDFNKMLTFLKVKMPGAADNMRLRVLKPGIYLGALGALLQSARKEEDTDKKAEKPES